jgi:hypothetical protein
LNAHEEEIDQCNYYLVIEAEREREREREREIRNLQVQMSFIIILQTLMDKQFYKLLAYSSQNEARKPCFTAWKFNGTEKTAKFAKCIAIMNQYSLVPIYHPSRD